MSNGLGLVDFAIWVVNSVLNLPKPGKGKLWQVKLFGQLNIEQINSGHDEEV